jgi:DNA-binding NarL/FixJ family response regulator
LRILTVDDHALFRRGLQLLLQNLDRDIEMMEFGSVEEALAQVVPGVDLILLDFNLPGRQGLEGLAALREAYPSPAIVVLSGEDHGQTVRDAIEAGAAGYIPKSSTPEVLIEAIRLVLAHGVYIPPQALRASPVPARTAAETTLTARQLDVLRLALKGVPNKEIARELDLALGTVKAHLSMAYRSLGVRNRTEAVFAAARQGIHL